MPNLPSEEYEIEDLQKEVAELKAHLDDLRRTTAPIEQEKRNDKSAIVERTDRKFQAPAVEGENEVPDDSSTQSDPAKPEPVPYEEYVAMTTKVNQYRRMVVQCNEEIEKLKSKVRNSKDISRKWKDYADKIYAKYKKAIDADHDNVNAEPRPSTPNSEILPPSVMVKRGLIPAEVDSDTTSFRAGFSSASPHQKSRPQSNSSMLRASEAAPAALPSPTTTDVKRMALTEAEGVASRPIRVKSEPLSSPIPFSPPKRSLQRVPTLDLNDVENMASTPHRRRRVDAWIQSRRTLTRKNTRNAGRNERSSGLPVEDGEMAEVQSDDDMLRRNLVPALTRADSDPNERVEDGLYDEIVSSDLARNSASAATKSRHSKVSHAVDSNKRVLPRTDNGITTKKRRSDDDRQAQAGFELAEDGSTLKKRKKSADEGTTRSADFNSRLTTLLNGPTPARHRLSPLELPIPKSLPKPSKHNSTSPASTGKFKAPPVKDHVPEERVSSTDPSTHAKTTLPSHESPRKDACRNEGPRLDVPRITQQAKKPPVNTTPLRSLPLSELKKSDFKVNPLTNQGYTYAFAEPLRSNADRRAGHACIDPNCCGPKMQALAADFPYTPSVPPLPTSELPYGVSPYDARILKEYMGRSYTAEAISNMPFAQQEGLIKQAKLRLVAEKFGKHRVLHQRHATPPGFWNCDFSTTQEVEEQRAEAERMERKQVEERWKEAMREGGLWLFRDEYGCDVVRC